MATYPELFGLQSSGDLRNRVAVAIIVAADAIRSESGATTNHANRLVWAEQAFSDPVAKSEQVLWAVLAANKDATVSNIENATDAALQANVDAVVDVLAGSA